MSTDGPGSARESTERIDPAAAQRTLADDDPDADGWRELARGESIGRYVVLGRIGAGGMGEVFAAYDPDLDRRIAIKLLTRRERGGIPRMMREAQAIAKVVHPNVVAVHDVGTHGGRMYVAMEFVDGENLSAWLDKPRTLREKLDVLAQAGRGLQAAHDVGLVHRDFKPDNVLVGRDGRARVADFGLARAVTTRDPSDDGEARAVTAVISTDMRLTQTGALVGTPAYMAPEQHLRLDADARSDQFAFCITAWEALFGVRPFSADSFVVLSVRVTEGRIDPPPSDVRIPGRIKAALLRGLAPTPDDRWPSMTALVERLGDDSGRRRRLAIAGGLVAIGTTVGFTAAGLRDPDTSCDPERTAIATVWDDDARTAVQSAFRAADVPWADDVLRTVTARLDDARERWSAEYVAACEATHVRGDQSAELLDRRMACLDERRRELVAVVDVLRDADAGVVQRGVETVAGLVPVDRCGDLEALQRDEAIPPADVADAVADVRAELQAALVLDRAGRPESAKARFEEVGARVEQIGWRPLEVELEVARQRMMRDDATPEVEIARLVTAYNEALALGDDDAAADLANDLGWEWGYRKRDVDRGLEWVATARALVERVRAEWLLEVRVLNNEAVIRAAGRDLDGAAPLFERAVALAEEHDPGGLRPVQLRANLAAFHAERGDYPKAIELLEQTRAGYEALLGTTHPRLGDVHANLANASLMLGDLEKAGEHFERARAIFEPALPPTHPQVLRVLGGMAMLARLQGHRERAIELNRRVLAAHEQGSQDFEIRQACLNLGTSLLEGDVDDPAVLAEVDELGTRAVALVERGEPPSAAISPLVLRIQVAQRRKDATAARALVARALQAAADPSAGPEERLTARTAAVDVALDFGTRGDVKAAIAAAEAELAEAPEMLATATQLFVIAKARWQIDDDRRRAVELAARAEQMFARRKDATGRLTEVREWLREHQG